MIRAASVDRSPARPVGNSRRRPSARGSELGPGARCATRFFFLVFFFFFFGFFFFFWGAFFLFWCGSADQLAADPEWRRIVAHSASFRWSGLRQDLARVIATLPDVGSSAAWRHGRQPECRGRGSGRRAWRVGDVLLVRGRVGRPSPRSAHQRGQRRRTSLEVGGRGIARWLGRARLGGDASTSSASAWPEPPARGSLDVEHAPRPRTSTKTARSARRAGRCWSRAACIVVVLARSRSARCDRARDAPVDALVSECRRPGTRVITSSSGPRPATRRSVSSSSGTLDRDEVERERSLQNRRRTSRTIHDVVRCGQPHGQPRRRAELRGR